MAHLALLQDSACRLDLRRDVDPRFSHIKGKVERVVVEWVFLGGAQNPISNFSNDFKILVCLRTFFTSHDAPNAPHRAQ